MNEFFFVYKKDSLKSGHFKTFQLQPGRFVNLVFREKIFCLLLYIKNLGLIDIWFLYTACIPFFSNPFKIDSMIYEQKNYPEFLWFWNKQNYIYLAILIYLLNIILLKCCLCKYPWIVVFFFFVRMLGHRVCVFVFICKKILYVLLCLIQIADKFSVLTCIVCFPSSLCFFSFRLNLACH